MLFIEFLAPSIKRLPVYWWTPAESRPCDWAHVSVGWKPTAIHGSLLRGERIVISVDYM